MPRLPCALLIAALAALAALAAAPAPARAGGLADELAEAERRKAALDWDGALAAVERGLAAGDGTPARVAWAHRLAGELAAGLGRADEAAAHFARWLALEPDGALRDGVAPKIAAPFEQARARLAVDGPLRVSVTGGVGTVTLVVDGDPLAMVAGGRARWRDARGEPGGARASAGPPYVIDVPAGASRVEVDALDAHGNAIWTGLAEVGVIAGGDPQPPRAWWARWQPWAAASAAGLVAGGVFAWRLDVAQDEWDRLRAEPGAHDYSTLVAVEDRGRRHALGANVALGVAAVTGVVAVIAALRDDGGEAAADRRGVVVSAGAAGGAVGATLSGRF